MHYDIFISYRRNLTADKAEHLLSLLSGAGYKGKVSFDKDNLAGRFDIEILRRIDKCKDFILILGKETFSNLSAEDDEDTQLVKRIADCSIDDFQSLVEENQKLDFVRIELARAIRKGKNIIPIAPADTSDYSFSSLDLPSDIAALTRYQAVFYSDKDNCFLFKDILPKITSKLNTRPSLFSSFMKSGIAVWTSVAAIIIAFASYLLISDWISYRNSLTLSQLESYSTKTSFPALFRGEAREQIAQIKEIEGTLQKMDYFACAHFSEDITLKKASVIVKIAKKMLHSPGGEFLMGSDDPSSNPKCRPIHQAIAQEILIGKYEVSQDEWNPIMVGNDGQLDYPISGVSWYQSVDFCKELSRLSGISFTLPYEREWEFTAGYGGQYLYSGSDNPDAIAWYSGREESGDLPHVRNDKRGGLDCNALEVYDMSGNVAEWCADSFALYGEEPENERIKVIRGGSVADGEKKIRITYRDPMEAESSSIYVGLRLAIYL